MNETSKHKKRHEARPDFYGKIICGKGIDVGCGHDRIHPEAIGWDYLLDPNQRAEGPFPFGEEFDYVYSSHCLEHLEMPTSALHTWWKMVKEGGHMVVIVPDQGLYEQNLWPSHYNWDHKSYWNLPQLVNLVKDLPQAEIIHASRNDDGFDYTEKYYDRTLKEALADIEIIVRKVPKNSIFRTQS